MKFLLFFYELLYVDQKYKYFRIHDHGLQTVFWTDNEDWVKRQIKAGRFINAIYKDGHIQSVPSLMEVVQNIKLACGSETLNFEVNTVKKTNAGRRVYLKVFNEQGAEITSLFDTLLSRVENTSGIRVTEGNKIALLGKNTIEETIEFFGYTINELSAQTYFDIFTQYRDRKSGVMGKIKVYPKDPALSEIDLEDPAKRLRVNLVEGVDIPYDFDPFKNKSLKAEK